MRSTTFAPLWRSFVYPTTTCGCKMFNCKLLSESFEIEPNNVDVSFTVLPTLGGEGKAVVAYSLGRESKPLRKCTWTVPTHYVIGDECIQTLAITDISVTFHGHDGLSTTDKLALSSLPQSELSERSVLDALGRSSVTYPTHRDFTLELKQLKYPATVQFSVAFIAQLSGSVDPTGALRKLTVHSIWPCVTGVNYSLSCVHFGAIKSVQSSSDPPVRQEKGKDRTLQLSYQREAGSGRAGVEIEVLWEGQDCATAVLSECPSEKFMETLGGSQILGVHLPPLFQCEAPLSVPFPQEFIFLVDCSGSMSGGNMHEVVRAMHIALRGLPLGSYFNVIAFGSKYRPVFLKSLQYTQESLDRATAFVSQLDAKLGGTELLTPLKWVGKQGRQPGLMRHIFIVTDGQAPYPSAVLGLVQGWSKQTICHVVAIGDEVCRTLVNSMAALSGGTLTLVDKSQELPAKVVSALERSVVPYVGRPTVRVDVPGCTVEEQFCQDHLLASPSGSSHYFVLRPDKAGSQSDDSRARSQSNHSRLGSLSNHGVQAMLSVQGVLRDKPVEWSSKVTASKLTSLEGRQVLPKVAAWNKLDSMVIDCLSKKSSVKEEDILDMSRRLTIRCPASEFCSGTPCSGDALSLTVLPTLSVLPHKLPKREPGQVSVQGWSHPRKRKVSERENTMSIGSYFSGKVSSLFRSVKWMVSSVLGQQEKEREEEGYSLDDIVMDEHAGKGLRWGEHGQLVFPSYYYSGSQPSSSKASVSKESGAPPRKRLKVNEAGSSTWNHDGSDVWEERSTPTLALGSSESVELRPADDFVDLLQLQLCNGAWPLNSSFAMVIGRRFTDLQRMVVCATSSEPDPHLPASSPCATAIALVFLRQNFPRSLRLLKLPLKKAESWLATHHINWDKLTDMLTQ